MSYLDKDFHFSSISMLIAKKLFWLKVFHFFYSFTFVPYCRRPRNTNSEKRLKRQAREESNEDDDGGFTREAAIVSPIRR
jgi:hypothetical protein